MKHDKLFKKKGDILILNTPSYVDMSWVNHDTSIKGYYEYVLIFTHTLEEMENAIIKAISILNEEGVLYLLYPKLKNKLNLKGIHRDHILPYLEVSEETGYYKNTLMRFNMMASFDDNYTILGIKKDKYYRKRR
jgi:hypothetical protein